MPAPDRPAHHAHRENDAAGQGGVGLGDVGLDAEDDGTGQERGAQQRGLPTGQPFAQAIRAENRDQGAEQGRQPIGPDRVLVRQPDRLGRRDEGRAICASML